MNQEDFEKLCERIQQDTISILVSKGAEYAGSEDRLANFKRGAMNTGVEPLTVLHVYMAKHWDSISSYVRAKQRGENPTLSEPIVGRFYDLINYAVLAIALIEEANILKDPAIPQEPQKPESVSLELVFADSEAGYIHKLSGPEADELYHRLLHYSVVNASKGRVRYQDHLVTSWRVAGKQTWRYV